MVIQNTEEFLAALYEESHRLGSGELFDQFVDALTNQNSGNTSFKKAMSACLKSENGALYEAFMKQHEFVKPLRSAKRESFLIRTIEIDETELRNGRVTMRVDGTITAGVSHAVISSSEMAEMFGDVKRVHKILKYVGTQEVLSQLTARMIDKLVFVKLRAAESEESPGELYYRSVTAVLDGITFETPLGERYAQFLLWSPSQSRKVESCFVLDDNPMETLEKLGFVPESFSKVKEGMQHLDVTKFLSRLGLCATSSKRIPLPLFGKETVEVDHGGFRVVGGRLHIEFVPDVHVEIRQGKYRIWDAAGKCLVELDAADHPWVKVAGEGYSMCNPRCASVIRAFTGNFRADNWQVRGTPAWIKGMLGLTEDLNCYFPEADIVVFYNSMKGDPRPVLGKYDIGLRIVTATKDQRGETRVKPMAYQASQLSGLTGKDLCDLFDVEAARLQEILADPYEVAKRAGLQVVASDAEDDDDEPQFDVINAHGIQTILSRVMSEIPAAYKDAHIQQTSVRMLLDEVKKYKGGTVPVRATVKRLLPDTYGMLQAFKYGIRVNGKLFINPEKVALRPGECYVHYQGETVEGVVTAVRAPATTEGEQSVLRAVRPFVMDYVVTKDGMDYKPRKDNRTGIHLSCMDFNDLRMGTADYDGDTVTMYVPAKVGKRFGVDGEGNVTCGITKAFLKTQRSPILDTRCPYEDPEMDKNEFILTAPVGELFDRDAVYAAMKKYVVRNLRRNEIGFLANYSTMLGHSMREITEEVLVLEKQEQTDEVSAQIKSLLEEHAQLQDMRDITRMLIGWEIDAPKHGGFYKTAMKEVTTFFEDPPPRVQGWMKPEWLSFRKGQFTDRELPPVMGPLDQAHVHATMFEANFREQTDAYMDRLAEAYEARKTAHSAEMPAADVKPRQRAVRKDVSRRWDQQMTEQLYPSDCTLFGELLQLPIEERELQKARESLRPIKAQFSSGMHHLMTVKKAWEKLFHALKTSQVDDELLRPSEDPVSVYQLLLGNREWFDHPVLGKRFAALKALVRKKQLRSGETLLQLQHRSKVPQRAVNEAAKVIYQDISAEMNRLTEGCRENIAALVSSGMRPEVIGYAAYEMCYKHLSRKVQVDEETGEFQKTFSGISFPWRVCLDELITAFKAATGHDVAPGERKPVTLKNIAFYCPKDYGQDVLSAVLESGVVEVKLGRLSRDSSNQFLMLRVPGVKIPDTWAQASSEYKLDPLRLNPNHRIEVAAAKHSANTLSLDLTIHFLD